MDRRNETSGLYRPQLEHDSCGVGFVAHILGEKSHDIIRDALKVLSNLEHRGATGAETNTGDGAGIMMQIPHDFVKKSFSPYLGDRPEGSYILGSVFISNGEVEETKKSFQELAKTFLFDECYFRKVPVESSGIGYSARTSMPEIFQVLLLGNEDKQKIRAYALRKKAEREISGLYFPSLSPDTVVYKGMLIAHQLEQFYPELSDSSIKSAIGLVHSRFSTNTFPSWPLSHPYRFIAHNGEINTLAGNRNWMKARESLLESETLGDYIKDIVPIINPTGSDSASFDEVLELLHMAGRSLAHSILMMIPEAWEKHEHMDQKLRTFYRYNATKMEAWDGPACIAFCDGSVIGAVLDRNGLRPARYWITDDHKVVMASEVGVLNIDPEKIIEKGRLSPGKVFLIDTEKKRIIKDGELKKELVSAHPYKEFVHNSMTHIEDLAPRRMLVAKRASGLVDKRVFGFTEEELRILLMPMARTGAEPIGSMGHDAAIAVLSDKPRLIYDYFSQLFAQVTNPALDAIREELVTSLNVMLGPEGNLLKDDGIGCHKILLSSPIIDEDELAKILYVHEEGGLTWAKAVAVDGVFDPKKGGKGLIKGLDSALDFIDQKIAEGFNIIVLSDRYYDENRAPIPSLLLVGAVHQHLVNNKTRTKVGLLVESGDAREVHHMACLLGFGASAICPYTAIEAVKESAEGQGLNKLKAVKNYIKALSKGILKVMSKMGISTVASYTGAQVFEAVGLDDEVINKCFTNTVSRIKGSNFEVLAKEAKLRHDYAFSDRPTEFAHRKLPIGGEYQYRREGEYHLFNPRTVFKLQHSTRAKRYEIFKEYTKLVDDQSKNLATLRGLFELEPAGDPIPIDEVEPISSIVKRFSTGAMSYGSISKEAHETLAIAMNRLGGKSNTGEGGEDPDRFLPDPNGDNRRSAIKQVASGRFGVTSQYLVNADALQIKIAQGAKPGEGGQLPGHKVYPWIAKTRYSTPGVGLISPPPHHDIYSIEDIAQLIFDLKNSNPKALVHVKLVAEMGVGTVAAGVAKAKSDLVLISGHDGGTGASPLSSIKHAGIPWELGLAETQQVLVANGLRDRIIVQVDGQLKTGRDVIVAALLGAEEFGFATAPLVVSGCIMMRVCHLDTCPVGIATQNPKLRERYSGKADFVVNFFEFIATEVREYLAMLGFKSVEEAVGRVDCLKTKNAIEHWKAKNLDLTPIFAKPKGLHAETCPLKKTKDQNHNLEKVLDNKLIELAQPALVNKEPVTIDLPIRNVNRAVGTMLGYEITKKWGQDALADNTILVTFTGSAGQSFGAFIPKGLTLKLFGDANDYLAKGLSGGRVIVVPPKVSKFKSEENIIAGNVIGYGATSGEIFIRGLVGERFCVRNSGATAVVEGIGDHGCEYMTGGRVIILGPTGRNFGAGMSGGIAYVYDKDYGFATRLNMEMVGLEPLDEDDISFLRQTIRDFKDDTESHIAENILSNFDDEIWFFKKVMPRDYRRVLDATKDAIERGEPVDEVIMAAAHG
jgi:glutamate synthase (NADPH/NADH) large chain